MKQAALLFVLSMAASTRRYILDLEKKLTDGKSTDEEFYNASETVLKISGAVLQIAMKDNKEAR